MGAVRPTLLLLGHTGKMGLALGEALGPLYAVVGRNHGDFEAAAAGRVARMLDRLQPAVIVNAVAFRGLDACERCPARALAVNALFPRVLAEWAAGAGAVLAHFSSEAVFPDAAAGQSFVESSAPRPINIYGLTKYGGDCFVAGVERHYIFRLPLLFGASRGAAQFVDKMAARMMGGAAEVRVAADCWTTPSYSRDIAGAVRDILAGKKTFGLYHLANAGQASLYDLIAELARVLGRRVRVAPVSQAEFPSCGKKNLRPLLATERGFRLRPWQEALREYAASLRSAARRRPRQGEGRP